MKKVISLACVSVLSLSLAACSTKKPAHVPERPASDYEMGAQTYALPGQPGYQGNQYEFYKNPMTAPANQTYYFAYDSNVMRSNGLRELKIQADYLVTHPAARVRLEGYTDDRGSREYNIGLGWRRDQSVAHFLEQQGVRPQQIKMVSYGKERPAALGETEKAWALNRRVNLVYEKK